MNCRTISKFRSVASILTSMQNFLGELSPHFQFKMNILCIFRDPTDGNGKDRSRVNVGPRNCSCCTCPLVIISIMKYILHRLA